MRRRNFIASMGAVTGLVACGQNTALPDMPDVPDIEAALKAKGIVIPPPEKPVANYVGYRRAGDLLFVAGQGPDFKNKTYRGTLGLDMEVDVGYEVARSAGLNTLAQVRAALGSLNNVVQCVKLEGFVNSADSFKAQPKVLNGASDLFVEVFGDAGRPARYAVGTNTLPFNVAVEIATVWQVR